MTKFGAKNFPAAGLNHLPTDRQEKVIELITKPLASQFLQLTVYSPSPVEFIQIAMVRKPVSVDRLVV